MPRENIIVTLKKELWIQDVGAGTTGYREARGHSYRGPLTSGGAHEGSSHRAKGTPKSGVGLLCQTVPIQLGSVHTANATQA